MPSKKQSPSRAELEAILDEVVTRALLKLNMVEDETTLCRTFRALVGLALGYMRAGSAPNEAVLAQVTYVLRKNLRPNKQAPTKPPPFPVKPGIA